MPLNTPVYRPSPASHRLVKLLVAGLLWGSTWAAYAACPTWPSASRFPASGYSTVALGSDAANNVVTDSRTGLQWARCSAGQTWSGSTCTGTVSTFTHEQALAYAQGQSGWRLPNVKELSSLADKGCLNPAIDSTVFPATSASRYWSSSPNVGDSSFAWFVYFYYGVVYNYYRSGTYAVRLVRASQ